MSYSSNNGPQDWTSAAPYSPGNQLFDPGIAADGGGRTVKDGIVAKAGGGAANATKVSAAINRITTAATAGDSVALPAAGGGRQMSVYNGGAAAVQVFAAVGSGDTINAVAGTTGVSLPAGKAASFSSPAKGVWFWVLSA